MLLIRCPYCAEERSEEEFTCSGELVRRPPDPASLSDEAWTDYLHFRDNPKGAHAELWRHSAGCGRYFRVVRDTVSYEILSVSALDAPPRDGAQEGTPE